MGMHYCIIPVFTIRPYTEVSLYMSSDYCPVCWWIYNVHVS